MSKRLQVIFDEHELAEIRSVARRRHMSVAEWVRQALRRVRNEEPVGSAADRLAAIRRASDHAFPVGPIDQLLDEIESGYRGPEFE